MRTRAAGTRLVIVVMLSVAALVTASVRRDITAQGMTTAQPAAPSCQNTAPQIAAAGGEVSPALVTALQGLMQKIGAAAASLPGLSVAIVLDQQVVFAAGFGCADIEQGIAATPQTIYKIESLTKVFDATMAMQQRDAGNFQLGDTVDKSVSQVYYKLQDGQQFSPTWQQLASHTAGLPDQMPRGLTTLDQFWQYLERVTVIDTPGQYSYSDVGFITLNQAASVIANQDYHDYVGANIFGPLGMSSSTYDYTPLLGTPTLAIPYVQGSGGWRPNAPGGYTNPYPPAGSIFSTVEDLAQFATLQFRTGPAGGDQILACSTVRRCGGRSHPRRAAVRSASAGSSTPTAPRNGSSPRTAATPSGPPCCASSPSFASAWSPLPTPVAWGRRWGASSRPSFSRLCRCSPPTCRCAAAPGRATLGTTRADRLMHDQPATAAPSAAMTSAAARSPERTAPSTWPFLSNERSEREQGMLIGLTADTHIPEAGPDLWPQVYDRFRAERVEAILHAGDIHVLPVLDRLERRVGVPVYACRGNGDDGSGGRPVCPADPRLRPTWVLDWHGFRIGLCHALEVDPTYRPLEVLMERYFGGPCDIVVYGDTHVHTVDFIGGTLLVNPGSPMYPRNMNTSLGTIGFLHLTDTAAEAWVEPLHPAEGPTLRDGGITDHRTAAARYPDQWVIFAVHGHDRETGLSHGAVVAAGFAPEEGAALERRIRYDHPSAVLLRFHSATPPERGIAGYRVRAP